MSENNFDLAIIIPCYNEYDRLPELEINSFLKKSDNVGLCFVNDASKDDTLGKLEALRLLFPSQVTILSNAKNLGKAESVRNGVLYCHKEKLAKKFAYLDADMAISLSECSAMLDCFTKGKNFIFSSRILKIGARVERKFSRFLFGRVIATFISAILDIKVYDTQCGCKIFNSTLAELLFKEKFISKWLFDVELFSRILCKYGKKEALAQMDEIPVKSWIDKGDSKVKISYVFRLWYDLYLIHKTHKKNYEFFHRTR